MKTRWTIAAILAAVLVGTIASSGATAEAAPEDHNNADACIKAGYVWVPQPSTQASKNRPGVCSDAPVVNTITVSTGQRTTITVSAPSTSRRVQCHGSSDVALRAGTGTYCVHQRNNDGTGREGVQAYACNGPYSLAPTTGAGGSTITYKHTDADGWIGMGGLRQRNDLLEVRGRQLRVTGVGDSDTGYVSLTLYGTQRVRFTIEGYGNADTYSWETQTCALQVRVRVNVRGPAASTSVNEAFKQARTNARELTTTRHTSGDYVPPNTSRCRVVRYDNGGEMSWCGTYTDENGREVAPDYDGRRHGHNQTLAELCRGTNVTCHRR